MRILPDSEYFHESNLIENFDDKEADDQMADAWQWLSEIDRLDHSVVCELQSRIVKHQKLAEEWVGKYRQWDVYIGGRKGTHPAAVPAMIADWLYQATYDDIDPKAHHIRFEHIHPFMDGNGRTGRMLMWWHEIKKGQKPTLIKFGERESYYDWFRSHP